MIENAKNISARVTGSVELWVGDVIVGFLEWSLTVNLDL